MNRLREFGQTRGIDAHAEAIGGNRRDCRFLVRSDGIVALHYLRRISKSIEPAIAARAGFDTYSRRIRAFRTRAGRADTVDIEKCTESKRIDASRNARAVAVARHSALFCCRACTVAVIVAHYDNNCVL
ncbi:hypothetical protein [Burkholderia pseudomallei]|uniref:hypothetical protein n=2 Tax=Burkholderia pseudomallei TaxID=28450 RepID=UPI0001A489C7|nr:hypothetical protein [Burkholderia pseudomallei]ACQ96779.1 hypothetical protein GBP346_A4080 [Burkholderia pseudomallei MSHR346]